MATVTVEIPDGAFSALRRSPEEFAQEMRIAAAIQWYHQTLISQGKAAEIAGLSPARTFPEHFLGESNFPASL